MTNSPRWPSSARKEEALVSLGSSSDSSSATIRSLALYRPKVPREAARSASAPSMAASAPFMS
jgi:hypothetical protein